MLWLFLQIQKRKRKTLYPIEKFNALSRADDKTFICSECGVAEAMEDFVRFVKEEEGERGNEKSEKI